MQDKFTDKAKKVLEQAAFAAAVNGHSYIGSEHLLLGLIQVEDSLAYKVLQNNDVTETKVLNLIYQLIAPDNAVSVKEPAGYTPRVRKILTNSIEEAARFKADKVGTEHILIAIMKETESVASRLLNTMGVSIKKIYTELLEGMGEDVSRLKEDFQNGRIKAKDKKATTMLDQYSRDLTELARNKKLDPVIGREEEIQRVIQILSRRTKNNPCLIGEPGVGKTAVVEGLALRIVEGEVPSTIKDKRLVTLDLSGMVAGSKYRGEFEERINQVVFVSATPADYENEHSGNNVVEQIIRPTGLLDPKIEVKPVTNQIDDLLEQIRIRVERKERVLVTTLTKKMAEDLTEYLKSLDIKVNYIHSDTKALERMEIIRKLRLGEFDVLVGINLLREGLDIPEVSLVAILDADKEGFLRSERSLIQTIGRAARNTDGTVIMYADELTDSMEKAIKETNRRRGIQEAYNKEHNITPTTIKKSIRDSIRAIQTENIGVEYKLEKEEDIKETINKLTEEMLEFASKMEFEQAAEIRDKIKELEKLI